MQKRMLFKIGLIKELSCGMEGGGVERGGGRGGASEDCTFYQSKYFFMLNESGSVKTDTSTCFILSVSDVCVCVFVFMRVCGIFLNVCRLEIIQKPNKDTSGNNIYCQMPIIILIRWSE